MTWDRSMHDSSLPDPRPQGLPDPVTVRTILDAFAAKLTELNDRSVRLGGQALSLGDPRDIAAEIRALAHGFDIFTAWGEDCSATAEVIGAKCVAFLLARARVDELGVDTGDAA